MSTEKYAAALRLPVGLRPVEVTDSGSGIPAEAPPRIFDRFFRAASPNIEGTGLGLSIAKAIADRYGLTLSITNQPAGGVIARVTILEVHHLESWHLIMLIRTASVSLAHES
jgi:signal transduction histidine kinase